VPASRAVRPSSERNMAASAAAPLRCVARRGQKAKGKNPVRLHTFERGQNQVLADPALCRLRRFAQQSQRTQPALGEQTLHTSRLQSPSAPSPCPATESATPSVGRNQLVLSQPLPQGNLRFIHRRACERKSTSRRRTAPARSYLGQRVLVELPNAAASPF